MISWLVEDEQCFGNFIGEINSPYFEIYCQFISFCETKRGLSFEDGCSTVTDFTAYLISQGIRNIINLSGEENKKLF